MTDPRPAARRAGLVDRMLTGLVRVQAPLGIVLIVGGFLAVFLGWLEASGTADVRIQLQDLISGGVGGLGMLLVGGVLLQSALADRAARATEEALSRLADALGVDGAGPERRAASVGSSAAGIAREPAPGAVQVLATHASFHLPGCDLLDDRTDEQVKQTSDAQARRRGLQPCRVCLPSAAGA